MGQTSVWSKEVFFPALLPFSGCLFYGLSVCLQSMNAMSSAFPYVLYNVRCHGIYPSYTSSGVHYRLAISGRLAYLLWLLGLPPWLRAYMGYPYKIHFIVYFPLDKGCSEADGCYFVADYEHTQWNMSSPSSLRSSYVYTVIWPLDASLDHNRTFSKESDDSE